MSVAVRRWWPAAVLVVAGAVVLVMKAVPGRGPAGGPVAVLLVREVYSHLLPADFEPVPLQGVVLEPDNRRLFLPTRYWRQWSAGAAAVVIRRVEHLDLLVAEEVLLPRRLPLILDLHAAPEGAVMDPAGGGVVALDGPGWRAGRQGGRLTIDAGPGTGVDLAFEGVDRHLAAGGTVGVLRLEGRVQLVDGPGQEGARLLAGALEQGRPVAVLLVSHLGWWPAGAVRPMGEVEP